MPGLAFEDFHVGDTAQYGRYALTREEVISFASQFDPQPMHLDEAAGSASILGGLAASGWHGCVIMMRLIADNVLAGGTGEGAPGIDQVRWIRPLRPGDVFSVRHEVLETRVSRSRPDRGFVRFRFELLDQDGAVAMEQTNSIMFGLRHPGATA